MSAAWSGRCNGFNVAAKVDAISGLVFGVLLQMQDLISLNFNELGSFFYRSLDKQMQMLYNNLCYG